MAVENQLGMSDEEFLKQNLGDIEDQLEAEEAANLQEEPEKINASEEEQTSEDALSEDADQEPNQEAPDIEIEASESNTEESEEETSDDEVTDPGEEVPLEAETSEDTIEAEPEDTDDVAADTETVETEEAVLETKQGDTQETAKVDFEAAYKRITSPFKASKRMMQVDNVDDAIALMQKGADYHNKMKTIAPHLKMVSMLEKEGLLDQANLNNLIDISKRDPKAIAQLIKDSGIDPLDIDTDEEVGYKPTNYGISDKEFQINQAIDDIRGTPSFDKTINVLAKEWDDESKKLIADNPTIIGIINEHVYNGVFDKVQSVMDTERALGRLQIPDVEAYRQIAEHLFKSGAIVQEGQVNQSPNASVPKPKARDDVAIKQKRKAAASTKKTTTKNATVPPNYLNMTDEEFMKLADI